MIRVEALRGSNGVFTVYRGPDRLGAVRRLHRGWLVRVAGVDRVFETRAEAAGFLAGKD